MIHKKDLLLKNESKKLLIRLQEDMKNAAKNLEFELAAQLRDEIEKIKEIFDN